MTQKPSVPTGFVSTLHTVIMVLKTIHISVQGTLIVRGYLFALDECHPQQQHITSIILFAVMRSLVCRENALFEVTLVFNHLGVAVCSICPTFVWRVLVSYFNQNYNFSLSPSSCYVLFSSENTTEKWLVVKWEDLRCVWKKRKGKKWQHIIFIHFFSGFFFRTRELFGSIAVSVWRNSFLSDWKRKHLFHH